MLEAFRDYSCLYGEPYIFCGQAWFLSESPVSRVVREIPRRLARIIPRSAMTLLIVEDEAIVSLYLRSSLEAFGHTVVGLAPTGAQAVKNALSSYPDLILMDIRLNGDTDGIEAAKQIRNHRPAPVIFITANTDDMVMRRASELEPLGYLSKPLDVTALRGIMESAVRTLTA